MLDMLIIGRTEQRFQGGQINPDISSITSAAGLIKYVSIKLSN